MNPNHNDFQPMAEKIDRLIHRGQPSGIPVADDLASTVPQANSQFQQMLEDRLAARLQSQRNHEGDEQMTTLTPSSDPIARRKFFSYIPLTLAAAILALVLVGSILFARGSQSPNPNLSLIAQETPAPTPEPHINVVVALQALPRGFQFPARLDELATYAGYTPWPVSAVPLNALTESEGGLGQLLGRILRVDLAREQLIISTNIVDDLTQAGGTAVTILPSDRVAVTIPTSLITWEMNTTVHSGDLLDIKATFLYTDANENFQDPLPPPENTSLDFFDVLPNQGCSQENPCSITQTVIRESLLLYIGPLPDSKWIGAANEIASTNADIITLSVSPDEAPLLIWLVEANIPLTMELAEPPRDFLPVVIAAQPLSQGDQVMPGEVIIVYWPPQRLPDGALDDLSLVQGKYLTRRVDQWQPLRVDDLVDASPDQGIIPEGKVAHELPRQWITNDVSTLKPGDSVDVNIAFLEVNIEPELSNTLTPENGWVELKTLFTGVRIFRTEQLTYPYSEDFISILLSPADAMLLSWLEQSTSPIAITVYPSDQNSARTEALPDGRLLIDLPADTVSIPQDANLTSPLNLETTLLFKGFVPDEPDTYSLQGMGNVELILTRNTQLMPPSGDQTYTLAVSPADLPVLRWALKAGLPIRLSPAA